MTDMPPDRQVNVCWRLLVDIRTERTARYCASYVACLACFFFWDFKQNTPFGVVVTPSENYFSILLVMASVPIAFQYSFGFVILLWQAMFVVITLSGIIMIPTIVAMVEHIWAGYLVVAAAFTVIIGPIFGAVEPLVLHLYAFSCAIIVEFVYTPLIDPVKTAPPSIVNTFTIGNLWSVALKSVCVNIGVYMAISTGAMLIPPWRTARVQLHAKAKQVLTLLSENFAAVADYLVSANDKPAELQPLQTIDYGLLLANTVASKDSIEELSTVAMLEPSLLHPGTLGALPETWKEFIHMAARAASRASLALADCIELERRGVRDFPLLDFSYPLVGASASCGAAAKKSRQQLLRDVETACQEGAGAVKCLGRLLLASSREAAKEESLSKAVTTAVVPQTHNTQMPHTDTSTEKATSTDTNPQLASPKAAVVGQPVSTSGSEPSIFSVALFVTLSRVLGQHTSQSKAPPDPAPEPEPSVTTPQDATAAGAVPHSSSSGTAFPIEGFQGLVAAVKEIQTQLSVVSLVNLVKQVMLTGGIVQLMTVIKSWLQGVVTAISLPITLLRQGKPGSVWHQPVHVYYTIQFVVGVWALLAASTFWNNYRNWQGTGGHGATWSLMSFLLVLQPTYEATLQKGALRIVATVAGTMLAWGIRAISSHRGWLIPISALVVAPGFWCLPDSRSTFPLVKAGELQYICVSFTFAYTMVMGYSGLYGDKETAVTRLVSQLLGCIVAIVVTVVIFPVSGTATATAAAAQALYDMEESAAALAGSVAAKPPAQPIHDAAAVKSQTVDGPAAAAAESSSWDRIRELLASAEAACKRMDAPMASLRAYPLSNVLASQTEGALLVAKLKVMHVVAPHTLRLLKSIAVQVQHLEEQAAGTKGTAGASAAAAAGASRLQTQLQAAVAAHLQVVVAGLRQQQARLHGAFNGRRRLLPLPYMPVVFPNLGDIEDGKGSGEQEQKGDASATAAALGGMTLGDDLHRLIQVLWDSLKAAVSGKDPADLELELAAYLEGGGGQLAEAIRRFRLGYHLSLVEMNCAM